MPDDEDIRAALRGLTADEPPLGFGSDEVVLSGRRRQYRRGGMVAGVASIAAAVAVTVPLMLLSGHDVAGTGSGGAVPKTAPPAPSLAHTTPPGIFPTCTQPPPPLPTATALPTESPTAPPSRIAPPLPTESATAGSSLPLESPSNLTPAKLPDQTTATAVAPSMAQPPTAQPSITQSPLSPPSIAPTSIAQSPTAWPSETHAPRAVSTRSNAGPPPTCAPTASR